MAARAIPGVRGVFTGDESRGGWDRAVAVRRAGRDGGADDDRAAAPGLGARPGPPCRRSGGVCRRGHSRPGARRHRAGRDRLPAAAGGGRCRAQQSLLPLRARRQGCGRGGVRRRDVGLSTSRSATAASCRRRSNRGQRSGDTNAAADRFDLLVTGQGVHSLRQQLANAVFHMPAECIAVCAPDVGGSLARRRFCRPTGGRLGYPGGPLCASEGLAGLVDRTPRAQWLKLPSFPLSRATKLMPVSDPSSAVIHGSGDGIIAIT